MQPSRNPSTVWVPKRTKKRTGPLTAVPSKKKYPYL